MNTQKIISNEIKKSLGLLGEGMDAHNNTSQHSNIDDEFNKLMINAKNNLVSVINKSPYFVDKIKYTNFVYRDDDKLYFIFKTPEYSSGFLIINIYGGQPSPTLKTQLNNYEDKIKQLFKNVKNLRYSKEDGLGDNDIDLIKTGLSNRAKNVLKDHFNKDEVYISDILQLFEESKDRYFKNPLLRMRHLGQNTYNEILDYIGPYLPIEFQKKLKIYGRK